MGEKSTFAMTNSGLTALPPPDSARTIVNNKTTKPSASASEKHRLLELLLKKKGIKTPEPAQWTPLVCIQPGDARRPFFCVHPSGGHVHCYIDLARYLGSNQPFYGIQARGVDRTHEPHTEISSMAVEYIGALRDVQPEGPYFLGGWSMGGMVAFEITRQLQAKGQKVALLALFDSRALAPGETPPELDDASLMLNFAQDIGLSLHRLNLSWDSLSQLDPDERFSYVLAQAKLAELLPTDIELPQIRRLFRLFKSNVQAMYRYAPQPIAGRITLFSASEKFRAVPDDPTLGWGELAAAGVEVYSVPGNHYTMLREPHLPVLAKQLTICVRKAME